MKNDFTSKEYQKKRHWSWEKVTNKTKVDDNEGEDEDGSFFLDLFTVDIVDELMLVVVLSIYLH